MKWVNGIIKEINQIEKMGVLVIRNKHIKRSVYKKASYIYDKLR